MSTTPSTSEARSRERPSYTVVGRGRDSRHRLRREGIAVVVLNRRGRFHRLPVLEELGDQMLRGSGGEGVTPNEVLCVEGPGTRAELEPIVNRYAGVRFLLFHDDTSVGERINAAIEEARSGYVLVVWSDMDLQPLSVPTGQAILAAGELCVVPVLTAADGQIIPSLLAPALVRRRFRAVPWAPSGDRLRTVLPFDFVGIYDRARFRATGGFDRSVPTEYWQALDFGMRATLWGETLWSSTGITLRYRGSPPHYDSTPDASYKSFYLKNIAVRFDGEGGRLPWTRLPGYLRNTDTDPLQAASEFFSARRWVRKYHYRFSHDVQSLVDSWEASL